MRGSYGKIYLTEHTFGFTKDEEDSEMTENEKELLNIIRSHDNPERAVEIAIELMLDFLKPREEPPDTFSAHLRESA